MRLSDWTMEVRFCFRHFFLLPEYIIYFGPWPTTGGEANNAAISCVPGDDKGSQQKLMKC